MDSIKLGIKIRKCRQARHLSQNELAEKAEISTRYLGDIHQFTECNECISRLCTYGRIACAAIGIGSIF